MFKVIQAFKTDDLEIALNAAAREGYTMLVSHQVNSACLHTVILKKSAA